MKSIHELIAELCPNGVEYMTLGDVAELIRGNGLPKSLFSDSGIGAIHYGQIYTHYGVSARKTISFVSEEAAEKLVKVFPGDVIVTNTSENLKDVCTAVAWIGKETIVTGGHATVIRTSLDPSFLSYWFRTEQFQRLKPKLAIGSKVIDISAKRLAGIKVPVPPLEVQQEIVRILDEFTQLQAELEAELEARRQQYEYYRDQLLTWRILVVVATSLFQLMSSS
ncbi:MAG: restriction endonuclease subunit S, partial [Actinomycetaceae bacterium]|nr:restriction endonuclease subunit S [Actinomycetaceae bacterium]